MLLTIVTINLNNANGLQRTLSSLRPLLNDAIEHVVIDGGSTDGSHELLGEWKKQSANVRLLTEPDTGIYNAMNKGWRLAQGEFVAYINSGDEVIPEAYANFVRFLRESSADVCYGKIILRSEDGRLEREIEKHPVDFLRSTIPHPSAAVKRAAFLKYGGFDEQYRICADRELFVRLHTSNATFSFSGLTTAVFYEGGISSNRKQARLEDVLISGKYRLISRWKYHLKRYWYRRRV